MELDRLDLAILDHLQANGRATAQELSDAAHLSPSPSHRRQKLLEDDGIIRRPLEIEFPEFREQRAEVAAHPPGELGLIRLLKTVEHPPRILQVAQRLLVVLLDFGSDARAIHPHHRAAVIARVGVGNSMLFGCAACH